MTRSEKIGAVTVGVLLFSGLAYFIYDAMRPAGRYQADAGYEDALNEDLDYLVEEDTETLPTPSAPASPAAKK